MIVLHLVWYSFWGAGQLKELRQDWFQKKINGKPKYFLEGNKQEFSNY
jgi:hypothetical protein